MSSDAVLDARFKRVLRWEPYAVLLLGWLACISVPLTLGRIGLSWDALNHHIYLGWVADRARFDQDYMAASLQAYQFPYLYWPVYKLAMMGVSGVTAGIVLATLHIVIVPPVWMAARILMPQQTLFGLFLRVAAVALAFMTALVIRAFETTGNDLLAAAPLVWAIVVALKALDCRYQPGSVFDLRHPVARAAILSGLLSGLSIAFKLSNGPLAIVLAPVFLFCRGTPAARLFWAALSLAAMVAAFAAAYGYWGFKLWQQFGNPLYPFAGGLFEWLGQLAGRLQ